MNKPKHIIVHHTAVSRRKNGNQFDAVKRYHKGKGWGDIGYHFFIEPDGEVKKGRPEHMEGAHCYQQGMNSKSLGICLAGHFDKEDPTEKQIKSLNKLIKKLKTEYTIESIHGHRDFAPKTCPGKNLPDELFNQSDMLINEVILLLKSLWDSQTDENKKKIGDLAKKLRILQEALGLDVTK